MEPTGRAFEAPNAVLFVAHIFKGNEAFRAARALGWHPILLTGAELLREPWDRAALADVLAVPSLERRDVVRSAAAHLARRWPIRRVATIDDPGVDLAAHLRAHLALPGMGESAARLFRDKLAMRIRTAEAGVRVPAFTSLFADEDVRAFVEAVPPPWILKPRGEASSRGVRRIDAADDLARAIDDLGDARGDHLVERFVRGPLFHVDAIVQGGEVQFAAAHAYQRPLLEVVASGGMMVTRTVPKGAPIADRLKRVNAEVLSALGLERGIAHTEMLLGDDGEIYFVESAARVGGANIPELVEAATGVRLWDEYVALELGGRARTQAEREVPAALLVGLARTESPDYAAFGGPEIAWRLHAPWQAGVVVRHEDEDELDRLVTLHQDRFVRDLARPSA